MNLFPIFSTLEKTADCSAYDFIDGVPSFVNRLLRAGRIDVSPSSSIEYLRNRGHYTLIEHHSISSFGPIGSIFLFSRRRIEELDGATILTSSQSETSVALLDILLRKFMGITCILKSSDEPLTTGISSFPAYLLIGDDAIRAVKGFSLPVFGGSVSPRTFNLDSSLFYIYDLGENWFRNTHLPFVFALWIARRDCHVREPDLLIKFKNDLDEAKTRALQSLEILSREAPMKGTLSEEEIVSYWKGISYDFTEEHRKGLDLFDQYAVQLGLIHQV